MDRDGEVRALTGVIHPMVPPVAVPVAVIPVTMPVIAHMTLEFLTAHDMDSDAARYNSAGSTSWDGSITEEYTEDTPEYSDTFSDDGPDTILVFLM